MKNHYLDFRCGSVNYRVKCTRMRFNEFIKLWDTNPSYADKLAVKIDCMREHDMIFSMADFTGRGGRIKKSPPRHIALPEPKLTEGQISERKKQRLAREEKWAQEGVGIFKELIAKRESVQKEELADQAS